MRRRKTAGAMLMFSAFVLIAAAPLAMSAEAGTVHTIVKDENGPPSTCAETWEITPSEDGTWYGHIVNGGMRWIIIDVMDTDTGDMLIDREMFRWMVYPDGWVDTEKVDMMAGHTYSITATPNGALGTTCTVEDFFEPAAVTEPPVASFTVAVDGLTVSVDASASYDPDGEIVDFDWDWGDGSTGTGMTATHTYVPPEEAAVLSSPTLGAPPLPHPIVGHTYDDSANPLPYCTVTITNVRLGVSATVESDASGMYQYDLANMGYAYEIGDEILVEAVKDTLAGSATGYVTENPFDIIDVTLVGGPEPFDVTITLTVTDDDGLSTTVSQTVTLYP